MWLGGTVPHSLPFGSIHVVRDALQRLVDVLGLDAVLMHRAKGGTQETTGGVESAIQFGGVRVVVVGLDIHQDAREQHAHTVDGRCDELGIVRGNGCVKGGRREARVEHGGTIADASERVKRVGKNISKSLSTR